MKNAKSLISLLLCIALCFGLCCYTFAATKPSIALSLDKDEITAGTATTIAMYVATSEDTVPVSISGKAYADNKNITISEINDGYKELSSVSTATGKFAWMNSGNKKAFSEWAEVVFSIPATLPAGKYTLGVTEMSAQDSTQANLLSESAKTITFTVKAAPVAEKTAKIALSLDKNEITAGIATMITMYVGTNEAIVPVSISGGAYSGNKKVTISAINDGDKELSSSSTATGKFAWMNSGNKKSFSNWAEVVFSVPADLPAGQYTLGVTEMSAQDSALKELLAESAKTVTFTVKAGGVVPGNRSVIDGYYYENGVIVKGVGVVKVGNDYYYIKNSGAVYVGEIWVSSAKANGLLTPDNYTFGADGKMVASGLKNGVVDGYYYENDVIVKAAGVVKVGNDYYYVKNSGAVYVGEIWVGSAKANGLLTPDYYTFGADGKMVASGLKNGVVDGYYYENDVIVKGVGVVKVGQDYYYIKNSGAVYVGEIWVSSAKANGLLTPDYYTFGADGKLEVSEANSSVVEGYYYVDGVIVKAAGVVKVGADYYYVKNSGAVYVGEIWVSSAKANGLLTPDYYTFGADGKLVN